MERDKERQRQQRKKEKKLVSMSEQKIPKQIDRLNFEEAKALLKSMECQIPDFPTDKYERLKTKSPNENTNNNNNLDNSRAELNPNNPPINQNEREDSSSFLSESTWFYSLKAPTIQTILDFNTRTNNLLASKDLRESINFRNPNNDFLDMETTRGGNNLNPQYASMDVVNEKENLKSGDKRSSSLRKLGGVRSRFRDNEDSIGVIKEGEFEEEKEEEDDEGEIRENSGGEM